MEPMEQPASTAALAARARKRIGDVRDRVIGIYAPAFRRRLREP
jgi:hypothetical protein